MDTVASRLGMSKRTLYEIFGSKDEMIKATIEELERSGREFVARTFSTTENVMEALIKVFKHNRDNMRSISVDFFRDLDLYKDKRATYDRTRHARYDEIMKMFEKGVEEGMFRPDVDYKVQTRIMGIQMEGLKRMEEFFPSDITLLRVYDAIIVGFLRSIASPKGMGILDRLTHDLEANVQSGPSIEVRS